MILADDNASLGECPFKLIPHARHGLTVEVPACGREDVKWHFGYLQKVQSQSV
jgi:hypothetical protein